MLGVFYFIVKRKLGEPDLAVLKQTKRLKSKILTK